MTTRIRAILIACVCTGAITGGPATALAADDCSAPALSNPLALLDDTRDYFLAPGGDFEDPTGAGWQFTGGAAIAVGSEPLALTGPGASSLSLPAGSSATSPEICIDLNYPTFRFMAAQLAPDANPRLEVDVLYTPDATKSIMSAGTLALNAQGGWQLTHDMSLKPRTGGKESGWRKVSLRFRTVDASQRGGEYRVDSLLIDPYYRN